MKFLGTVRFETSKCEVPHQGRQKPVTVLTLCGDRLEVATSVKYLGSLIRPGGDGTRLALIPAIRCFNDF